MLQSNLNPPRREFDEDRLDLLLDELIASDIRVIDRTVAKILHLIEKYNCWDETDSLELALREALANAIIHGNRSDAKKTVRICVGVQSECNVLIIVKDTGSGFDPAQLPNPIMGQNIFAANGRGIFLINCLLDDLKFNFDPGTAIYLRRKLFSR